MLDDEEEGVFRKFTQLTQRVVERGDVGIDELLLGLRRPDLVDWEETLKRQAFSYSDEVEDVREWCYVAREGDTPCWVLGKPGIAGPGGVDRKLKTPLTENGRLPLS